MRQAATASASAGHVPPTSPPDGGGGPKHKGDGAAPLPEASRDELRAMLDRVGEAATMKRAHVSRAALMRALAGLPIRRGTAALLTLAIQGEEG